MSNSIYKDHEYVVVHCGGGGGGTCDVHFCMSRATYDETKRTGRTWYCPNGHPRVWGGDTTEQKLEAERARASHLEDQLRASIAEGEATRQQLLRDRHRFANGVCPCCQRSFTNVANHMRTQHPEYDATPLRGPDARAFKCSCGASFESYRGLRIHQGWNRGPNWDAPGTSRWNAHLAVTS